MGMRRTEARPAATRPGDEQRDMTGDPELFDRELTRACAILGLEPDAVIAWRVYPDHVVVIDDAGRKLTAKRASRS